MKKFLSILTLLLTVCSGAWAKDEVVIIGSHSSGDYTISGTSHDVAGCSNGSNSTTLTAASDGQTASAGTKLNSTTNIGSKLSGKGHVRFTVSAGETVRFYYYCQSSSKSTTIYTSDYSQDASYYGDGISCSIANKNTLYFCDFTYATAGTYAISHNGDNIFVAALKFTAPSPSGPSITTQPESASYVTGATISALTVAATASGGTLSYQWYSCDDAAKTNAAAISGATSASYTPTAAGFYYVTVTDSNGSVDSDVVEIAISAAEAPTISVSGTPANAVVVGTEVTLTATATGNPTPTIKWYDGTDAEVGTGETYSPSTATAGTYTFYAVASNGVGTDATSAVQSIVVKEQVATPTFTPNGAYFENSQEVTIASETADATIQYSTDGGTTWNNYTTALTLTATTTVKAKATKDGYIDSEVATATFTKFVKTELAEVSTATTWDWTSWDKTVTLNETTTPSKNDTYTYSDIAMINNLTLPSGFKGDAITFKGVYPVRSKKSQDGTWTIKVAAPGTLAVTFSDTGTKLQEGYTAETQPKRYLYINGVKTDYYTQRTGSANDQKIVTLSIAAGENVITTADADNNYQAICLYKLVYTPVTSTTVEVGEKLYRTFASKYPLDFTTPVSGLTAYKANVTGDNVTFEEVTGKVPAGEGLLLKATAADTYTISVPAGEVATIDNALVGVTKETTIEGAGIFVLYADDTHPIGFYKTEATSFTVGANTAYLPANTSARTFIALDEETTGIDATLMNSEKVNSEVYNLNGQRVAQPSKGLYIVNGRKVVIK